MAASPAVNVLRWGALAFGLVYGFTHNAALQRSAEEKRVNEQYSHRESLIAKAKAAYAQSKLPASQKSADGKIVPDWENGSNLDAYFKQLEAEA
ncbi:F1F0 ATP synthase subunit e, mitochondrial [Savitreella phatthalungensis]